jgi:hypothetical protein
MSDRSVSVKLRAEVNAYVAGMRSAAEATVGLERATKSAQESARAMTATMNQELARQRSVYSQSNSAQNKYFADLEAQQKRQHESMSKIGTASVVMGGAIAVGIGAAVKSFMEFDKEMSAVGAAASAHGQVTWTRSAPQHCRPARTPSSRRPRPRRARRNSPRPVSG